MLRLKSQFSTLVYTMQLMTPPAVVLEVTGPSPRSHLYIPFQA